MVKQPLNNPLQREKKQQNLYFFFFEEEETKKNHFILLDTLKSTAISTGRTSNKAFLFIGKINKIKMKFSVNHICLDFFAFAYILCLSLLATIPLLLLIFYLIFFFFLVQ